MWVRLPPPAWLLFLAVAAGRWAGCGGSGGPPSTTVAGEQVTFIEVAKGLDRPVYVAAAPGEPERLYVVEQEGIVQVVEHGDVRSRPFLDVSEQVLTSPK